MKKSYREMKQKVRISESQLRKIVKESVTRVINEIGDSNKYHEIAGFAGGKYDAMLRNPNLSPEERKFAQRKSDQAYNVSTGLMRHNNGGKLYNEKSSESAEDYRKKSRAYMNAWEKGYDKYRRGVNEEMKSTPVNPNLKHKQERGEFVDVKNMVENFLKSRNMYDPPIEWINDNTFTDRHGFDGHIYRSVEDAYNDIVSPDGDEHQNAIDSLDGAQSEEDWIDYLIHGGVDPNKARRVIMSHDWDSVIKIIIKAAGPEWFLSSYSGQVYDLDDGSLLFY